MNIIVNNKYYQETDKETLFGEEDVIFTDQTQLPNLVVELGLYKSTSEARRANRAGDIPLGWTEMKGNKRTPIWIWNPWC